jgi:hypothetical protein
MKTDQHTPTCLAQDEGTRLVTIEDCEYRVSKEVIINFPSSYGELVSDVLEVVVNEGNTCGDIHLRSCRVKSSSIEIYHNWHLSWRKE